MNSPFFNFLIIIFINITPYYGVPFPFQTHASPILKILFTTLPVITTIYPYIYTIFLPYRYLIRSTNHYEFLDFFIKLHIFLSPKLMLKIPCIGIIIPCVKFMLSISHASEVLDIPQGFPHSSYLYVTTTLIFKSFISHISTAFI